MGLGLEAHRSRVSGDIIVSALKMSAFLQAMSHRPKSLSGCAHVQGPAQVRHRGGARAGGQTVAGRGRSRAHKHLPVIGQEEEADRAVKEALIGEPHVEADDVERAVASCRRTVAHSDLDVLARMLVGHDVRQLEMHLEVLRRARRARAGVRSEG